jgi:RNA polymerase sigma-70 factor (ECF subfamily)
VTDKELTARCRRREREAQRVLYERCGDRIYRLLLRMTHNADDAADLTQETFIRAFEKIGTFGGTSSLTTWVYRIAVNEALQFLRRRRTEERAAMRVSQGLSTTAPSDRGDTRLDVTEALARIPDDDRALLVLRYIEGLSYNEMAEVLNKPAGTIASGLNRARQLLRDVMQKAFGTSE